MIKSILLIIRSNFRSRKGLNILTGTSVLLAALLFNTATAIMERIHEPFDKLFDELNASHITLLYDVNSNDTKKIKEWFLQQPEVKRVSGASSYYLNSRPLLHCNNKMELMVQLTEFISDHQAQDKLLIIEGKKKAFPSNGELWLPKYLCDSYHINVGDTIRVSTEGQWYPLTVTAVVADPHYGSGMINPTRAWVAPGELSFFVPANDLVNTMMGIRLKNATDEAKLIQRFSRDFSYDGMTLNYSLFKGAYMSIYQMITSIMMIFSIMALVIALVMVRSTVRRSVLGDYKFIGVYRAIGLTPLNVMWVFILQHILLTLAVLPLSIVATVVIVKKVLGAVMQKIGAYDAGQSNFISIFCITGTVILLLVIITAWLTSIRVARIKPIEAIRNRAADIPVSRFHLQKRFMFLPLPLQAGLHFLMINSRRSIVLILTITMAVFVTAFSVNISSSFAQLKNNKPAWGFEKGEVQLIRRDGVAIALNHEQLKQILDEEKQVASVVPFSYSNLAIFNGGVLMPGINGKVYADSLNKAGLKNLIGRHPLKSGEISLCAGTARQYHLQQGDSIEVFIEGERLKLLVTGIYQDVSSMGQGFRLQFATMKELNPLYSPSVYNISLRENVNIDTFKQHIEEKLAETIAIDKTIDERITEMGIVSSINAALFAVSFFFVLIILLSISNDILIGIAENRKVFGVFKSVGWTPRQLRLSMLFKTGIMTITAVVVAVPLSLWLTPLIMALLMSGMGLIKFPAVISYPLLIAILIVLVFIIIMSSWWLSKATTNIHPRTLTNE